MGVRFESAAGGMQIWWSGVVGRKTGTECRLWFPVSGPTINGAICVWFYSWLKTELREEVKRWRHEPVFPGAAKLSFAASSCEELMTVPIIPTEFPEKVVI